VKELDQEVTELCNETDRGGEGEVVQPLFTVRERKAKRPAICPAVPERSRGIGSRTKERPIHSIY